MSLFLTEVQEQRRELKHLLTQKQLLSPNQAVGEITFENSNATPGELELSQKLMNLAD